MVVGYSDGTEEGLEEGTRDKVPDGKKVGCGDLIAFDFGSLCRVFLVQMHFSFSYYQETGKNIVVQRERDLSPRWKSIPLEGGLKDPAVHAK